MVSERPGRLALRMFDNDSLPASPPSTHGFLASPPLPHSAVRPSVTLTPTARPTSNIATTLAGLLTQSDCLLRDGRPASARRQ